MLIQRGADDLPRLRLELRHGMGAAAGAVLGLASADQAAAGARPVKLAPVGAEHVQIEEPPGLCALLQITAEGLERGGVHVHDIEPLAAGVLVHLFLP